MSYIIALHLIAFPERRAPVVAATMSKKKGMSADEKKQRVHELFLAHQDVFQLKEVEKLASKEKGVNSMLVKDIVQALVDDNLVDTDKIGASNYYWSFPSKVAQVKRQQLAALEKQVEELEAKLKDIDRQLEQYDLSDKEAVQRDKELAELEELQATNDKLHKKLLEYRDCDPDVLEQGKKDIEVSLEAANRWTDNVMNAMSYCKKNFDMAEEVFCQHFNVPRELDYIE